MLQTLDRKNKAAESEVDVYDYIVVGGGSAGCVVANKLSAPSANKVALLEAGPDTLPNEAPHSIYHEEYLPDYFQDSRYWTKLEVYSDPIGNRSLDDLVRSSKARRYEQARVMGGGSSVNGQVALRGLPSDYDEWGELGAEGWSWESCLPYFKRVERDLDFDGEFHGKAGRIPIRRQFPEIWPSIALAFRDALEKNGIDYHPDANGYYEQGCFPFPRNNAYGRRVSAAEGYLDNVTRQRPNLRVLDQTLVEAVEFDGRKAVAVRARRGGEQMRLVGKEIILCAGVLHTPSILMRAGVGPGDHLQELGIPVIADRPGIGANLKDHPLVGIGLHVQPQARISERIMLATLAYCRFSSGMEGCPRNDMKMSLSGRFLKNALGPQFATVRVGPDKAYSQGFVRLRSRDPNDEPVVAFNLLSDWRDKKRMIDGLKFAYKVLTTDPMPQNVHSIFAALYNDWIRRMNSKSVPNRILSEIGGRLLDAGRPSRNLLMKFATSSGFDLHKLIKNDEEIAAYAQAAVLGNWHACGSVKMGAAGDRLAGVDGEGRVYGVEGLRVIDASVMPSIPCANINLTTIMIAEKMTDQMLTARQA